MLLLISGAASAQAAEIDFSSATDFIRMEVLLKDTSKPNPYAMELNVTLSPEATERLQEVTRESLGQPLTLSINGRPITTAIVQSVLGAQFRVSVPKDLLPTLIE
ncbi:hypothetical protein [Pseudomonas purpurea]|uniref:hypothetical protein n=1 Tax=Pseudomonas purpurea TaxID=3136737 RepID=UPI00326778B9